MIWSNEGASLTSQGNDAQAVVNQIHRRPVTEPSANNKLCHVCGKDVTGKTRMKDSKQRYWCIDCGAEDQRRKLIASFSQPAKAAEPKQETLGKFYVGLLAVGVFLLVAGVIWLNI